MRSRDSCAIGVLKKLMRSRDSCALGILKKLMRSRDSCALGVLKKTHALARLMRSWDIKKTQDSNLSGQELESPARPISSMY